jgi:hypothetical protein
VNIAPNANPRAAARPPKARSAASCRAADRMSCHPPPRRRSGGRVSGAAVAPARMSAPTAASTKKMPRQDITRISWPPMTGAIDGATPVTRMRSENTRAAACPLVRSRTTAFEMTIAMPPANPCRNLAATSVATFGDTAQQSEKRV